MYLRTQELGELIQRNCDCEFVQFFHPLNLNFSLFDHCENRRGTTSTLTGAHGSSQRRVSSYFSGSRTAVALGPKSSLPIRSFCISFDPFCDSFVCGPVCRPYYRVHLPRNASLETIILTPTLHGPHPRPHTPHPHRTHAYPYPTHTPNSPTPRWEASCHPFSAYMYSCFAPPRTVSTMAWP